MQEDDGSEPATDSANIAPETPDHSELIDLAKERFQLAYDAHKDDFEACQLTQDFIAGDQWPDKIKRERESFDRPCLTLDHLTQYVRHVMNTGLLRYRDIRVMAMDGQASEEASEIIAGIIRQIGQSSTAKVAYETALRHGTSVGFGYIRVQVVPVPRTNLQEIHILKIRDPRMVLIDPFALYPDGRDAQFCFVLTKLTKKEFDRKYPGKEDAMSWHMMNDNTVLPWTDKESMVLAEYYYQTPDGLFFAIMTPNYVLEEGKHHGDAMPIVRVVGDEYEVRGKERKRGMINPSSMDAQRAYNYASSAFIENCALAPLAPWVAAEKQVEDHMAEWSQAHRVPRAVLRYRPTMEGGQLLPPPQRAVPAGIPEGWQGMMENMINSTQMIMGLSQPNVLGTGGIPVQSGAGIEAQQEPGDVNTLHFIEHWHGAIEQTGRVILAMIPFVYTQPQILKIVGEDGALDTAIINPQQQQAVMQQVQRTQMGMQKVTSKSYNPMLGRYDAAISTGPPSATKKSAASKGMLALVQVDPTIMQKCGDIVIKNLDIPGADAISKRYRDFLPPGIAEDDDALIRQQAMQLSQQNKELQSQLQEAQQIILGEREKAQADIQKEVLRRQTELQKAAHDKQNALLDQSLSDQRDIQIASIKAHVELETNLRDNIMKLLTERMRAENRLDVESVKMMMKIAQMHDQAERMSGYAGVLDGLSETVASPSSAPVKATPAPSPPEESAPKKKKRRRVSIHRSDGSHSILELHDQDEDPLMSEATA